VEQEEVTGPVMFYMTRFAGPQLPIELGRVVGDLRNEGFPGVRLLDASVIRKNADGTLGQPAALDPMPETHDTGPISKLLIRIESRNPTATPPTDRYYASPARGRLFNDDPLPDPRDALPAGSHALVLLIEQVWATPFRDAILRSDAAPIGSGWVSVEALEAIGLMSREAVDRLATA
jgi:hypothetical protein